MTSPPRRSTKHPVKDEPLRLPGESLRTEIAAREERVLGEQAVMLVAIIALIGLEWFRWWFPLRPSPWLFTGAGVPLAAYFAWRMVRELRMVRQLRVGLKGELAVGQELQEALPPHGYFVLHDIPGDGFNIDHVAIGPAGVFSIETKTRSKPVRGNPRVDYDGNTILVDGFSLDRDPVAQAKAGAKYLATILWEQTGTRPAVQPIVVFPGWWVQRLVPRADVWVLNSKELPGWVKQQASHACELWNDARIRAAVEGLKRHVRSRHVPG